MNELKTACDGLDKKELAQSMIPICFYFQEILKDQVAQTTFLR